jgi:hypothetical protein
MTDTTNSQGVPMDDSELNDPGSDNNAPDPLLGEAPQSGAIGTATGLSSAPTQGGARKNASDRYNENQSEMTDLKQQYADATKQQSDNYAQQKKILQDAQARLMNMQMGPSDQEQAYRIAAAGATPGHSGWDIGNVNATQAEVLKERREAALQREGLIEQYATGANQAAIGQGNQRISNLTQQQRIVAGQLNSAGNQQFRGQANMPWYVKDNGDGTYALQPGAERVMDQQAMSKLFGRFTLLPQPDGSKKIVTLGGQMPAAATPQTAQPPAAPPANPAAPPAKPVAAPPVNPSAPPGSQSAPPVRPPVNPVTPGSTPVPNAAQPPPGGATAPAKPLPDPYSDLFLPSTVLDPKYGALTPQTKPAYVQTAHEAFDPTYFKDYQFQPTHFGDMAIRTKQVETEGKELGDAATASQQMIYNYGHALQQIDGMGNDQNLRTGPAGAKIAAFTNTLRGVLPDDVVSQITNDPGLNKLATQQETDKYFLQAATTGLKAIYGGRITNMEVQQRLKSLPGNNLLPEVTRMLAQAQADVAQDTVNKGKLFAAYVRKGGDPAPGTYNTWYEANFSPFHDSRLKENLATQQIQAKAPAVANNPMVQYYLAVAKAKAAGAPPPPKPPGM